MSEAPLKTDIAVIGAGPVGLFAVFEAGMLDMRCVVLDALDVTGGQCAALYPEKPIYDIPGHPRIDAQDLVDKLVEQAAPFHPEYRLGSAVTTLKGDVSQGFAIETAAGAKVQAKAVVIAAGCGAFGPNRPPLAGLEGYEGKSVHYLVRRREEFRDQRIVIAGGGDSAVDWALSLPEVAAKVMVVHRRPKFRAAPESEKRLHQLAAEGKVELVIPYQLDGLEGAGGKLSAVIVKTLDGKARRLEADHLLAFFGLSMDLGPIASWSLNHDKQHITVDPATLQTSTAGIFAVGDIAQYPGKLKLILSGFSEVAMALHAARNIVHPGQVHHFEYSTTRGVPGA